MIHILDMLDLVEAQIEACEMYKGVQAFDVWYKVVVEVYLSQWRAEIRWKLDMRDLVLAEAQFL